MAEKHLFEYENDEILVTWDKNICEHAAECVRGNGQVFDPKRKPWIDVDAAPPAEIIEVIGRCPSGALKYRHKKTGETNMEVSASGTVISVVPNGPLRLSGSCVLQDHEGNVIASADKMSLCRCGQSQKKPYCDGSHKKAGFEG